jgi:hypothetical protein
MLSAAAARKLATSLAAATAGGGGGLSMSIDRARAAQRESGEWLETEKRVCAVCGELPWKAMRVREFGNQVASRLEASGQPSSMISRLGRCKGSGRSVGRPRAAPVPGKLKSTACEISVDYP